MSPTNHFPFLSLDRSRDMKLNNPSQASLEMMGHTWGMGSGCNFFDSLGLGSTGKIALESRIALRPFDMRFYF